MKHYLKIDKQYLLPLIEGFKTFEIRFNDRNYKSGDILVFNHEEHSLEFEVLYILYSGFGLKSGWVIMSIRRIL